MLNHRREFGHLRHLREAPVESLVAKDGRVGLGGGQVDEAGERAVAALVVIRARIELLQQ
jgi:hypothetical protein|eukprot:jgi/Chrpa1/3148/Chrysochromulina_OHIO_Genome00013904-RA